MHTEECINFNKGYSAWTYTHENRTIKIKYNDKIFNDTEIISEDKSVETVFDSNIAYLQELIAKSINKDKEAYAKLNFK